MKPNWDDAPEWANYVACDEDGEWYWYEEKPYVRDDAGLWSWDGGSLVEKVRAFTGWKESLEERP